MPQTNIVEHVLLPNRLWCNNCLNDGEIIPVVAGVFQFVTLQRLG